MQINSFISNLCNEYPDEISLLKIKLDIIENELQKIMEKEDGIILKASNYVFNSGGKRIRPILLELSSMLCNYNGEADILFAQVVEMVHTATLIHDDIIDDSNERRGKPSAHITFGNNMSILLGDYLFSKAMELAINFGNNKILSILSETMLKMINGEIIELIHKWDTKLEENYLIEIIKQKTGYLFSICTQIPAILTNLPEEKENALKYFGLNLGIAFQILDDLLDYTSKKSILGKPTGNDLKEGKITLPLLYLIYQLTAEEYKIAIKPIEKKQYNEIDYQLLTDLMIKYNAFEYTKKLAYYYANQANSYLSVFENSIPKILLQKTLNYIVSRES